MSRRLLDMRRARGLAAVVAIAMALLMSACSVPNDGWIAIGRAADGELRVYLRTCTRPVDGATLYWPDNPREPASEDAIAEWGIKHGQRGPISIDWPQLGRVGNASVVMTQPLFEIPDGQTLALTAWTNDASATADGPYQFTARDLQRLRPGELLSQNTTDTGSGPSSQVITRAHFEALDCAKLG